MRIGCLVLSHKDASVEAIERAWVGDVKKLVEILNSPNVSEFAFLFTCNRFEVYAVSQNVEAYLSSIAAKLGIENARILLDDECLRHILRVASGLESMIVGEDQILGQVRHYHNLCRRLGTTGEILDRVFGKAINVGARVRRETAISKGCISIGSAAVELAERILGSLSGKKVLLIGAGEMGTLVAKALASKDVEAVLIANRTFSRAEELAREIGGIAVRFDRLEEYLATADVVVSATAAPHVILTEEVVRRAASGRRNPLMIIDIALPRDVEESVGLIPGVMLYTIDDLREISEENLRKRLSEVEKAEKIVEEELEHLKRLLKELRANRAIASMYSHAEKFVDEEVDELLAKLSAKFGVGEEARGLLQDFARSLIKKILRQPTVRLREAARDGRAHFADAVCYLFGDGHVSESEVEEAEERHSETACEGNPPQRRAADSPALR